MSMVRQRARIARVRRTQHNLAALAAAKASDHVRLLETNSERLGQMRSALAAAPGATSGAALASRGELGMRLENARDGLGQTILSARAAAAMRAQARVDARREQESAEKLQERAVAAASRDEDRRMAGLFRHRVRQRGEGEVE